VPAGVELRQGFRLGILIAMGWVLLLPPAEELQAPRARWQHGGSFVSSKDCDAARAERVAAAEQRVGDPWMIPDLGDPVPVKPKVSWTDSRCVDLDDPRMDSTD
jgi:hypothetical protein